MGAIGTVATGQLDAIVFHIVNAPKKAKIAYPISTFTYVVLQPTDPLDSLDRRQHSPFQQQLPSQHSPVELRPAELWSGGGHGLARTASLPSTSSGPKATATACMSGLRVEPVSASRTSWEASRIDPW